MRKLAQAVAALAALFYLVFGVWCFVAPESFAANIAMFGDSNVHYLHDLGAFQVGLGVAALAGLIARSPLVAVLSGVAAGSVLHAVSHVVDAGEGGRGSDPYTVSAIAVVLLVGLFAAWRASARGRAGS